jgi:Fe-S cluster assembly protein SufD
MISAQDNTANFIQRLNTAVKSLTNGQAPAWLSEIRQQGLSRFNELGIPTVKDEEWKYTNLAPLAKHTFELIQDGKLVEQEQLNQYCSRSDLNVVFVNGIFSEELSNLLGIPEGITISTLQDAIKNHSLQIEKRQAHYKAKSETAFVALNRALSHQGAYISIDDKIIHKGLIHIIYVTSAGNKNTVSVPQTLINVGKSSETTILESYMAFNDQTTYFSNALTNIFIEENATVHYGKFQKESLKAFHIGTTRVWQERNSNFDGFTLTAGSQLTRNNLDITLNGEGASAILNGLYAIYKDQHVDNHTSVDHRVPNCTSNQLYKGILNDNARAVFNGKIFVRPIAQQTNSYQLNKNLLLGEACRIDTKPQLEIFADDVKCTHGATIGQLDTDQMFYLQTRCIPRKAATIMLVHGFVDDLFQKIQNDSIRQKADMLIQPFYKALS